MRVNYWWKIHKWVPVAMAMRPIMSRLMSKPELGMLHAEPFFRLFPITTCLVTYWTDFESLEKFAKDRKEPHLGPWARFNRQIGNSGTVGIWHETYVVRRDQTEAVYGNMPKFGLGAAFQSIPIDSSRQSARDRLNRTSKS